MVSLVKRVMTHGSDVFLSCWVGILGIMGNAHAQVMGFKTCEASSSGRGLPGKLNFCESFLDNEVVEGVQTVALIFQVFSQQRAYQQEVLVDGMAKRPRLVTHRKEFAQLRGKYLQQGHCIFFLSGVFRRVSGRVGRVAGVGMYSRQQVDLPEVKLGVTVPPQQACTITACGGVVLCCEGATVLGAGQASAFFEV